MWGKRIGGGVLVGIREEEKKVSVMCGMKGEEEEVLEVEGGGRGKEKDGREWYVGGYVGKEKKYVCVSKEGNLKGGLFEKCELSGVEGDSGGLDVEDMGKMGEICVGV